MSSLIFSIKTSALQTFVAYRLERNFTLPNLSLQHPSANLAEENISSASLLPSLETIPLKRIRSRNQLEYGSALALKWADFYQQSASTLADKIVANLQASQREPDCAGQIWQNFEIWNNQSGWIYFNLNETGVAEWLQFLVDGLPKLNEFTLAIHSSYDTIPDCQQSQLFQILQAHARCCSLLRAARQDQLVPMLPLPSAPLQPHHVSALSASPQPLPWLEAGQLRCQQPSEWELITQICDALDFLAQSTTEATLPALKIAARLSQAFQTFQTACRIWGEVKRVDLPLVQVRIGLVLITQSTLRLLLESHLHRFAPFEL